MIKKKLQVLCVVICCMSFTTSKAQNNESEKQVISTVQTYFKGYKAGSPEILKEVFHQNFHLSWSDPWRNNAFFQVNREGMFKFFNADWSKLKINSEILEAKVFNNSAYCLAKVTLEGLVVWTDHINLLKLSDGKWWIVSKTSEGKIIK
ncbi:nuclear transport factor 2 family protein [Pontimicrobium aquaticum]|uniref:Nuclear transport factor 2 family protein n=1 Tax=Pontimicrobium aquaticum TaxID=2565367 RepID=A0A4U0EYI0_9FLAO|nr:nuclear transport factor 2 family protein [Pontimicrobium aquaticum]TJY37073.1 nuclear transport factor 2 family protein [Pontimicrobium aquaticum]